MGKVRYVPSRLSRTHRGGTMLAYITGSCRSAGGQLCQKGLSSTFDFSSFPAFHIDFRSLAHPPLSTDPAYQLRNPCSLSKISAFPHHTKPDHTSIKAATLRSREIALPLPLVVPSQPLSPTLKSKCFSPRNRPRLLPLSLQRYRAHCGCLLDQAQRLAEVPPT